MKATKPLHFPGMDYVSNLTLGGMLSHYVSQSKNDRKDQLPVLLLAYRCAQHSSTQETPFYLTYGRDPLLPVALLKSPWQPLYVDDYKNELTKQMQLAFEVASRNLQESQKKAKDHSYKEGDQVFLFTPKAE